MSFTSVSSRLVLLLVLARASTCFAQSFATPITHPVGNSPLAVAVGDLNGDSKLDLAVPNFNNQNVSVMIGNGDGSFSAKVDYAVGGGPVAIVIADLNSDGKPDLATASQLSNISVLLGNGDGTFQPKTDYALAAFSGPNAIVSGDLNGDNKLDLITINQTSGASVFLNNGDGTFASPVTHSVGNVNTSLVIADFNNDGNRDLAAGTFDSGGVKILLGNGNGSFQTPVPYPAGLVTSALAANDINGDNKVDLIAGNLQSSGVSVLLGNGDGTFGPPSVYPAGSAGKSIGLADLNGDSKTDVVLTNASGGLYVLAGNGDGSFREPVVFSLDAFSVGVGDLNGDNKPDLVTASGNVGTTVSVLINVTGPLRISGTIADGSNTGIPNVSVVLTGGTPVVAVTGTGGTYSFGGLPSGANLVVTPAKTNFTFIPGNRTFNNLLADEIADFNGFAAHHVISGVVRDNNGQAIPGVTLTLSGGLSATTTTSASDGSYAFPGVPAGNDYLIGASLAGFAFSPAFFSVNNLTAPRTINFLGAPVTYQISGTAPSFSTLSLAGSASRITTPSGSPTGNYFFSGLAAGGTYTVSATAIQPGAHFSKFLINAPSSQTFSNLGANATANFSGSQLRFLPGISPVGIVAADFNLDSRPDLAVTGFGLDAVIRIFVAQPDSTFQFSQQVTVGCNLRAPLTADFNGDGKVDLALIDGCNNRVSVLLGNGDATFQSTRNFTVDTEPIALAAADLNNDGLLDLCTVNHIATEGHTISILSGIGDGNFNPAVTFISSPSTSVAIADLNGDGKADLVTPNANNANVSVLLGNGNGTFQNGVTFPLGLGPRTAAIGDLNGDLKPDLVVTNNVSDTVSILIGNGSGGFGPHTTIAVCHQPDAVKLADFNADAKLDVVVGCGSDHLSSMLGNGDGTFQTQVGNEAGSGSLAVADFNSDAKLDVAILEPVGIDRFVTILRNVISLVTPPSISGQVRNFDGSPAPGVQLNLSRVGQSPLTTTTDVNGNYTFANLLHGSTYIVQPSLTHFSFSPVAQTFQDITQNQVANFTATRNTPGIVGRVTDFNGVGLKGVTVTLSGSQNASATTNVNGTYSFANLLAGGNYVVTPSFSSGTFTPSSRTLNNLSFTTISDFRSSLSRTLQFSAVSYEVSEGVGSITVTVTRTGDTSGPASVGYRTRDNPAEVRCDVVNGIAFARCDYATSVDTLSFAAGETAKTLSIPIIDDTFAEGDEKFSLTLIDVSEATLGLVAAVTVTIKDNDVTNGPNPIFTTPFFVRQHYLDFLSREPEVGEPWSAVLNNCSDVNNNPACDRITVSSAFFGSPEFQLKGYFVYRFYKLAFDRLPLYTEIVVDMRAVTGQTPEEVFQKKAGFTSTFTARSEFVNSFNSLTNAQYVSTLMGRYSLTQITTPDPSAPDGTNKVTMTAADLTNALNTGTLTRAQVLRAISDSDQIFSAEFFAAFVAMQYYGYLRRTPESGGYNAWLNYLNANPSDFRTMVNGFMNSIEYRLRFGTP